MSPQIIETEQLLDSQLPAKRLEEEPSADLLLAARAWSKTIWAVAKRSGPMELMAEQIEQGLRLAQNPVFIFGVHRSGTTLLQGLLDGHPQLTVLPSEGTFYTNQESKLQQFPENDRMAYLGTEWLRRLANPINQPPYWLLGRSTADHSPYVDFARYVMAWWQLLDQRPGTQWPHMAIVLAYASCTNNLGARYWVDKTPTNERFLQRIWQELPQARIIHIVREPMSTLASRKAMEPGIGIRSILSDLELSYRVAVQQSAQNDPRFLLVRYEELCAAPEDTTARIAAFLGIDSLDSLQRATVAGMPVSANSSFSKNAASGKILKANEHITSDTTSPTDRWQAAAYLGDVARQLGYDLPDTGIFRSMWQRAKFRSLNKIRP